MPLNIEIGPGEDPQPGYNAFVEVRKDLETMLRKRGTFHHMDFQRDGLNPNKGGFENNTADRILAIHMLEHVGRDKQAFFFKQCKRVLKPGGVLEVHVPNLDFIVKAYEVWRVKGRTDLLLDNLQVALFGAGEGHFHKHRIAYNAPMLRWMFEKFGFRNVKNLTTQKKDRHTIGWEWVQTEYKRHFHKQCPPFSLIMEGTK